ncbi:MAG: calcium/sodium antiporter, partial [Deltaproteobacteria bacterium]
MIEGLASLLGGVILVFWSADRFVTGAAATARCLGIPSLLIGMVVVGFGTSAPEIFISAVSSLQGNPGIAVGNAWGSNIANISLILGASALVRPIEVRSGVLKRELPVLLAATGLAAFLFRDGMLSRSDGWAFLGVFSALLVWSVFEGTVRKGDALESVVERELDEAALSLSRAVLLTAGSLVLLLVSSKLLVWGAVRLARAGGVSDLVVGLTVVALGTSLPELASSLSAVRKGEFDIALGNAIGSNLFNTLAVVGIAGVIRPASLP